jgi:predicted CoA-binding protein
MAFENPDDETLRALLETAQRVVVVGLSPKENRDSNQVASFLQGRGYEIVPVYPREKTILGAKVYERVRDVSGRVDVVDVFRRGEDLPGVVEDAIAAGAPAVWFQLGCVNEQAAERARSAGLQVVMDRCIEVESLRLLGPGWRRP